MWSQVLKELTVQPSLLRTSSFPLFAFLGHSRSLSTRMHGTWPCICMGAVLFLKLIWKWTVNILLSKWMTIRSSNLFILNIPFHKNRRKMHFKIKMIDWFILGWILIYKDSDSVNCQKDYLWLIRILWSKNYRNLVSVRTQNANDRNKSETYCSSEQLTVNGSGRMTIMLKGD